MEVIKTKVSLPEFRLMPQGASQPMVPLPKKPAVDISAGKSSSSKKRDFSTFLRQQSGKRSAGQKEGELQKHFGTPGEYLPGALGQGMDDENFDDFQDQK